MAKKNSKIIRVDPDLWGQIEIALPDLPTNSERIRWLYHDEFLKKIEKKLMGINKKGSFFDFIPILIMLIIVSSFFLIGYTWMSKTNTVIQDSDVFDADSKALMNTQTTNYKTTTDNAFLMFFILLCIGVFALAALVRVSPLFLPFYLVCCIFLIFLGAIGSNMYDDLAQSTELSVYAAEYTFTSGIMNYLPIIFTVLSAVLAIVMYKSWSSSQ